MPDAPGSRTVFFEPPIADFMRRLKDTPDRLDKGVRERFRTLAREVRDEARGKARGQHPVAQFPRKRTGTKHWQALVNSITSGSTSTSPYVSLGSNGLPWALGYEFGSIRHKQFPPWGGNRLKDEPGYFFFPTVRAREAELRSHMSDIIDEAMAVAFPD
jgi:hypothetical protein